MSELVHEVITRPYTDQDHEACLNVFDSNLPNFFDCAERKDFCGFLNGTVKERPYLVLEYEGKVIGCGGLAINTDEMSAFLSWGMVESSYHGKGLGKLLTEARLDLARATPEIEKITLNTSQHTQGFYAKFGFQVTKVTADGYGMGLDRWDMVLCLR